MPEERIIPAVQSVAEFRIKANGTELPRSIEVIAVHVTKMVNKIATARIIVRDGDAATNDFAVSSGDLLIPGTAIGISAGPVDEQVPVFDGIIIKHSISIRDNRAPQLVIECKHKAVKATLVRRSHSYHDSKDHEAIAAAFSASGIDDTDLESTTITHKSLVQYQSTDWDFAVSRAEANGKMILTNNGKIVMKAPDMTANASLSLLFGATIIELDTELDSRTQYNSVKAQAWDMSTQQLQETTAAEPSLAEWGNLDAQEIAAAVTDDELLLQHAASLPADEIQVWADAQLLKNRLAKIRGRVKFEGIATINPGDILELHGLGDRFNGNALVTGIRQDYNNAEGWKTQAQLGIAPEWFAETEAVHSPKAAAMLPAVSGLQTAIVTDNEDPSGEYRVRVRLPLISNDDEGIWARMALADAGNNRGLYFRPEIGDEVLVGFLLDDPRYPVILGMLHSSALASPLSASNSNNEKGYTSRSQLVLSFHDDKKEIRIKTPAGNKIVLSDNSGGIRMQDQHGNTIEMGQTGIKLSSMSAIEITAATNLSLSAANLSLAGNASLALSGSGSSKLESTGILELKGALIKIN